MSRRIIGMAATSVRNHVFLMTIVGAVFLLLVFVPSAGQVDAAPLAVQTDAPGKPVPLIIEGPQSMPSMVQMNTGIAYALANELNRPQAETQRPELPTIRKCCGC
jgi:hypothetical protein